MIAGVAGFAGGVPETVGGVVTALGGVGIGIVTLSVLAVLNWFAERPILARVRGIGGTVVRVAAPLEGVPICMLTPAPRARRGVVDPLVGPVAAPRR